jgi:hypothetical protein
MKTLLCCLSLVCGTALSQAQTQMDFSKQRALQQTCRDQKLWNSDDCRALAKALEAQNVESAASAREIRKESQQLCERGNTRICQEAWCPLGSDSRFSDAELQACAAHFNLPASESWVVTRRSPDGAYWVSCLANNVDYLTEVGARATMRASTQVIQGPDGRFRADAIRDRQFSTLEDAIKAACPASAKAARPFIERTGGTVIR